MEFLNYPEYKRYLILNLIYRFGPISRTRLMELTDYIPATVSNIVKELLEEQLIVEQGFAYAGQGRRRTLLEINNNYICAFGVSISQASILAIVSTIQGDILKRIEHPLEKEASSGAIVDIVLSLLSQLSEEFSDRKVLGIGICDPGIIDPINNQSISSVRFSDWQNIHLKAAVEERTHLPVRIAAANTLSALAEQYYGAAQGLKDFLCLELTAGIGMSFVANGLVVKGRSGYAGEIGHTIVNNNKEMCYCGNCGCMEQVSSLPHIKKRILAALKQGVLSVLKQRLTNFDDISVDDIRWAIEQKDSVCMHIVFEAAEVIGIAVANAVNLMDPECVIFSGDMVGLGDEFIAEIVRSAKKHILMLMKDTQFRVSTLRKYAHPIGATTRFFLDFLRVDDFRWLSEMSNEAEEMEV